MKSLASFMSILLAASVAEAAAAESWIDRTLKRMTLDEKIAQMVFPVAAPNFLNQDHEYYQYLRRLIGELKVGGIHVWTSPTYDLAYWNNRMQSWAAVPLLITADLERGSGSAVLRETYRRPDARTFMPDYVTGGAVRFPSLMALGAIGSEELAEAVGAITAREARSVGIHLTFSPVVDVNNNPDNPIINCRSFGEDVDSVGRLSAAYIRGCQKSGVLATAKHFPGHGDTSQDTHIELPILPFDQERLDRIELPPFRAAIAAGVKAVMSAHIALPAITGERTPATLSPRLITGLLRQQMGFRGLIVTDALVMGGIAQQYGDRQAAAMAVKAGVDVLLYPADPWEAVAGVKEAVRSGEIDAARIEESARRILRAKAWAGLDRRKTVELAAIETILGKKEHFALAREVAERSLTLLRNQNRLLPLGPDQNPVILKISDQQWPNHGRLFRERLAAHLPVASEFYLWGDSNEIDAERVRQQIAPGSLIVCPAFFYIGSWKGSLAVPQLIRDLLDDLKAKGCRLVLISFASPYIVRELPMVDAYLCAYDSTAEIERAAAELLLGRISARGKLPVTIPGLFDRGQGIVLE